MVGRRTILALLCIFQISYNPHIRLAVFREKVIMGRKNPIPHKGAGRRPPFQALLSCPRNITGAVRCSTRGVKSRTPNR